MTAFDRIAPAYDIEANPLLALEERILGPILPDMRGLTVADIGAGTGRWLRRIRAGKCVAIDTSPAMLSRAPGPRAIADAAMIPLCDASFDVVLCTFTLGYAPHCFPELARITRRTLIVTDVHPERDWTRLAEHHPYSIRDLTHPSLTRTHFREPHIAEPERVHFAAKPHLYEPSREHPAIFIAIWTKKCS